MSNQETSFVTLAQRVLAYPLKWVFCNFDHIFSEQFEIVVRNHNGIGLNLFSV